ncbi:uncharacterized protein K452DRAFT_224230 [Aplosporella prunicola CBS 121167]|uniref:Major facilitator superfamily (MFS) profile domain-containing protein n=1 Tax=Aplosporella prunicola CBS 121167 TaxID=1176127 RepID=A0A6A6BK77_9PEZI|nr:uncharacterized protein K452DRAFT_224230 [Aplosporella prunicola CBS 121167]KAF2143735.1 hypothetical protein K452DRAFT_224230 [Aplosporella prunicola CBS 121167]
MQPLRGHRYAHAHDELDDDDDDDDEATKGLMGGGMGGAAGAAEDFELYTPDEERRVLRKLDRKLVLFMAGLYMLSFLDRSNIGNARIAGLAEDLQLDSDRYEWLLTAFYVTYIAFEWMTLMYRIVPPHMYISACVFSWGLLASLQAVSTSFSSMVVLRALLGIAEAAFGPGLPYYLSFFFRREELAFRTGLFISAAPLSTSFASSLAWAITSVAEQLPGRVAPWRLLFLVEGAPSLFVAVWAWGFVPDGPGEARWLDGREREVAVLRLRRERDVTGLEREKEDAMVAGGGGRRRRRGIDLREVAKTLRDPKAWLTALMFFLSNVAFSSLPVFLPTIIQSISPTLSKPTTQALSAPPYLLAFPLVLLTAYLSDRHRRRGPYLIGHALLASLGYALLALSEPLHLPPWARYLALFPAAAGFFAAVTLVLAWQLNNQASVAGRGTGVALLGLVGQCGPLLGTRLYPEREAPFYATGMWVCAGAMLGVACLAAGLAWWLGQENARAVRDWRAGRARGEDGGDGDEGAVPLVAAGGEGEEGRSSGGGPFLFML